MKENFSRSERQLKWNTLACALRAWLPMKEKTQREQEDLKKSGHMVAENVLLGLKNLFVPVERWWREKRGFIIMNMTLDNINFLKRYGSLTLARRQVHSLHFRDATFTILHFICATYLCSRSQNGALLHSTLTAHCNKFQWFIAFIALSCNCRVISIVKLEERARGDAIGKKGGTLFSAIVKP